MGCCFCRVPAPARTRHLRRRCRSLRHGCWAGNAREQRRLLVGIVDQPCRVLAGGTRGGGDEPAATEPLSEQGNDFMTRRSSVSRDLDALLDCDESLLADVQTAASGPDGSLPLSDTMLRT